MRLDGIKRDFEPLESFPVSDVGGVALVDEGLGHQEVGYYDGDNHGVVLIYRVDTLEVSIDETDRRETSWGW